MIRWERSINHRSIRQQESICDHLTPSPRFGLMSGLLVGRKISDGIPMNFSSLQKRVPGEVWRTLDSAHQPLRLSPKLQVPGRAMHTMVLQLEKSSCIVEFSYIIFSAGTRPILATMDARSSGKITGIGRIARRSRRQGIQPCRYRVTNLFELSS